ncbi:mechanosensitive ion channel family protein [Chitinophaga sp. OAE865]|uniref:mechanosensitive ion channel family protein n=1 Tax=Chitinophaga sp. OAE865 TaxID=2817898 RepID=UPI001AE176B6
MSRQFTSYSELIFDKLHNWLIAAVKMTPNLVLAVIIFTLFLLLARLTRKLSYGFSRKLSESSAISGLVSSLFYGLFLLLGLFISLNILRLDKAVTSLLAGAGIIGLALGFAFQDLTANFISGIFITFKKPFDVGHVIETNGFTGTVDAIQLRSTTMITADGLHVIIPNKEIFQKPIINHSLTPLRRIALTFTIPLSDKLTEAEKMMTDIVMGMKDVVPDKPKTVWYSGIEGAAVKVALSCWVSNKSDDAYERITHELITKVTTSLKTAGLM